MGFAHAARAEENDIASLIQESPGGELVDETLVDGRLSVKIKSVEMLLARQVGELQVEPLGLFAAKAQLAIEQDRRSRRHRDVSYIHGSDLVRMSYN